MVFADLIDEWHRQRMDTTALESLQLLAKNLFHARNAEQAQLARKTAQRKFPCASNELTAANKINK